jgi:hypothetical protein
VAHYSVALFQVRYASADLVDLACDVCADDIGVFLDEDTEGLDFP